jgi:diguanylate cyclase (GGDEF)-like protein
MLRVCGEALMEKCPPTAQSGRIGGDEFLVLLPHTAKLEAEAVMEAIREYLTGIEEYPYKIVMSMGSAVKDRADDDINTVMVAADEAMYANKKMIKGAANIRSVETQLV